MALRTNPTLRQRRLGTELRRMREQAGLGGSQLARQLGINPAHVTQMESGRTGLSVERLYTIADLCMCTSEPLVSALADIIINRGPSGWWEEYRGVLSSHLLDLAELEGHASKLTCFSLSYVPGLLQTGSYANALFAQTLLPLPQQEVDTRTTFRLRRQQVVRSTGTPYSSLLYESCLRGQFGGAAVLRGQLASLLEDSERPGISIRVVPFDAAVFPIPSESIGHMAGPVAELDTIQLDAFDGSRLLDSPAQLGRYRATFDRIGSIALSEDESRVFIRSIMKEMQGIND
ncbi:helix-turn-helix transcriptional regulator [Kitasatospora sp. NBC_01250]|uniref:helix-turn-helix domain-containing protein n=1 Tax=unclassified Kitasatospora TaxID=2633591 RepID=UPI002E12A3D6|nr:MULTISPECIES: helix-turn-helix transcriptional regulator [unclassified Kitasatospora]WSJ68396.1 helix-turn-helix transcriptional regulator [Kitasatospora sp. NBC_01302]